MELIPVSLLNKNSLRFLFILERACTYERGEGQREKHSVLSADPDVGLDAITLRS